LDPARDGGDSPSLAQELQGLGHVELHLRLSLGRVTRSGDLHCAINRKKGRCLESR
jgi:hypothetical protein